MANRVPIETGEWYHCYNRGVDKRVVFDLRGDYERFLVHMYLSNGTNNIRASTLPTIGLETILVDSSIDRGEQLVEIGAYSLMPNHVHFVLKQIQDNGIALFMQKMFTGYTMYFNNKNERTGSLFNGSFKSKHIIDDRYLKKVLPYVMLNHLDLFKNGSGDDDLGSKKLDQQIREYPYSSLMDFLGTQRPVTSLVGNSVLEYYDSPPTFSQILEDALAYRKELEIATLQVKPVIAE